MMKKTLFLILGLLVVFCIIISCKKGGGGGDTPAPPPVVPVVPSPNFTVTTGEITVTPDGTTGIDFYKSICSVSGVGTLTMTDQGICWGTAPNPTLTSNRISQGKTPNVFTAWLPRLPAKTKIYVRAYAMSPTETQYGNEMSVTTPMAIGYLHAGGIIFSLDATSTHGLVASETDLKTDIAWAPGNLYTTTTGATSAFNGSANTTAIISKYGAGTYPAKLCRDYLGGGFADWYLPSRDELTTLRAQRLKVGQINYGWYWTSTEDNSFRAWQLEFRADNNQSVGTAEKRTLGNVRAIRAF